MRTAEEEGETSLSGTTGRQRRRRGAWVGVTQPFTAAGVGTSLAAAQGSTSSSSCAAAAAATGISRWALHSDACLWRGRLQQRKMCTAATAPAMKRTYNPLCLAVIVLSPASSDSALISLFTLQQQ